MSLSVAIQMDPVDDIDIDGDSTFVLALEAQRRGHEIYHYLPRDLSLSSGRVTARARPLEVRREPGNHATLGAAEMIDLVLHIPDIQRISRAIAGKTDEGVECFSRLLGYGGYIQSLTTADIGIGNRIATATAKEEGSSSTGWDQVEKCHGNIDDLFQGVDPNGTGLSKKAIPDFPFPGQRAGV